MKQFTLDVNHQYGLHARPAAEFVRCANEYTAQIQVRNVTRETDWVNGKSITSLLLLGVSTGHKIELRVEGEDELRAAAALQTLIQSNFA